MAGPKIEVGSNKICPKKVYTSEIEIAVENNKTTSFGEKGSFICGYSYFGKQLLPQINICCREVMQNNKVTSLMAKHYWMPVASKRSTSR